MPALPRPSPPPPPAPLTSRCAPGQCCCAGSRLFVHAKIYDEFVKRAVARAEAAKVGDPFDELTTQGPQVSEEQMHKILGYVTLGVEEGANLLTGGMRHGERGFFVQPTVFGNVTDQMAIAREEIFGPVMSILKFDDYDEVVRRANTSPYGLAAGIWTQSLDRANTLARGLRAGTVWINMFGALCSSNLPCSLRPSLMYSPLTCAAVAPFTDLCASRQF